MAKESHIVAYINDYLLASLTDVRFSGVKAYGITELHDKTKTEKFPAFIADNGELQYVGIDDTAPLSFYHRCNSSTITRDSKGSFGSGDRIDEIEKSSMSLFLVADSARVKMNASQLKDYINDSMPGQIDKTSATVLNVKSAFINCTGANFNSTEVYKKEYKTTRVINPKFFYVELKYDIEVRYSKSCVQALCCDKGITPSIGNLPRSYSFCQAVANCSVIQNILTQLENITTEGLTELTLVSGAIDGANTTFVWSDTPTMIFWQNGKLNKDAVSNGYTLTGTTSTHTEAPAIGDKLTAYK